MASSPSPSPTRRKSISFSPFAGLSGASGGGGGGGGSLSSPSRRRRSNADGGTTPSFPALPSLQEEQAKLDLHAGDDDMMHTSSYSAAMRQKVDDVNDRARAPSSTSIDGSQQQQQHTSSTSSYLNQYLHPSIPREGGEGPSAAAVAQRDSSDAINLSYKERDEGRMRSEGGRVIGQEEEEEVLHDGGYEGDQHTEQQQHQQQHHQEEGEGEEIEGEEKELMHESMIVYADASVASLMELFVSTSTTSNTINSTISTTRKMQQAVDQQSYMQQQQHQQAIRNGGNVSTRGNGLSPSQRPRRRSHSPPRSRVIEDEEKLMAVAIRREMEELRHENERYRLYYEGQVTRLVEQLEIKEEILRRSLSASNSTPAISISSSNLPEGGGGHGYDLDLQLEGVRREAARLAREGQALASRLQAAEDAGASQAVELRRLRGEREGLLRRLENGLQSSPLSALAVHPPSTSSSCSPSITMKRESMMMPSPFPSGAQPASATVPSLSIPSNASSSSAAYHQQQQQHQAVPWNQAGAGGQRGRAFGFEEEADIQGEQGQEGGGGEGHQHLYLQRRSSPPPASPPLSTLAAATASANGNSKRRSRSPARRGGGEASSPSPTSSPTRAGSPSATKKWMVHNSDGVRQALSTYATVNDDVTADEGGGNGWTSPSLHTPAARGGERGEPPSSFSHPLPPSTPAPSSAVASPYPRQHQHQQQQPQHQHQLSLASPFAPPSTAEKIPKTSTRVLPDGPPRPLCRSSWTPKTSIRVLPDGAIDVPYHHYHHTPLIHDSGSAAPPARTSLPPPSSNPSKSNKMLKNKGRKEGRQQEGEVRGGGSLPHPFLAEAASRGLLSPPPPPTSSRAHPSHHEHQQQERQHAHLSPRSASPSSSSSYNHPSRYFHPPPVPSYEELQGPQLTGDDMMTREAEGEEGAHESYPDGSYYHHHTGNNHLHHHQAMLSPPQHESREEEEKGRQGQRGRESHRPSSSPPPLPHHSSPLTSADTNYCPPDIPEWARQFYQQQQQHKPASSSYLPSKDEEEERRGANRSLVMIPEGGGREEDEGREVDMMRDDDCGRRRKGGHEQGGFDEGGYIHEPPLSPGRAPFATNFSELELDHHIKPLEQALLHLHLERSQLHSEMDKLLPKHVRTIKDLDRMAYIESRLVVIGADASRLKIELKKKAPA